MTTSRKKKLSKSPVIVVTGMHRSGTSLTAAFIQALGASMGSRMLPADHANAKGYFEDIEFLEFQRSLLQNCCHLDEIGWHDWGWTASEFLDYSKFQDYTSTACQLIQVRQSQNQIWGWKDPRTSLLLDFWHTLLPETKYVFVYRFPWDVVDSIRRINQPIFNRHPEYPVRIWTFYNRHILDFYRKHSDRCVLFHVDAIERQPEQLIQLLRNKLNIPVEIDYQSLNTVFEKHLLNRLPQDDLSVTQMLQEHSDCFTLLTELENFADIPSQSIEYSVEALVIPQTQANLVKASVIIPCFNQGEFLVGAIASAEESVEVNYEIIVIDDGSTELKTQRVLDSLETRGYQIIRQNNQGLANARNRGISLAKGQYVLPLDADNRIRPNYLCKAIEILERFPQVGIIYGDLEYFGEQTGIRNVPDFNFNILLIENYIDACAVIRKNVWESCGGYDSNMPFMGYEDWDLWLSAVTRGWQFHHIPEVQFDYYVRSHSMVSACKLPANRRILVQYLCTKHASLYNVKFQNVIAQKDYFLFIEQKRNELLQSQLAISQSPWLPNQTYHLPLVSVCLPTHNGEEFLKEALESLLQQTYLNLEIIISDDASTDNTLGIVHTFQQRLLQKFIGGVSVISHTQYGLVRNWNFCITQSRGKYIKFLFQDDVLESDCIEAMVHLAEQDEQIGMVFSPRTFLLNQKATNNHPALKMIYESCKDAHKLWANLQAIQDGKEFLSDSNLLERPFNKIGEPSTVLIRREILHKIGLFDPQFQQLVDLDLWLRIMGHSKIGFINRVLSHFRLHLKQQTLRNMDTGVSDMFIFYRKLASDSSYGFLLSHIRHLTFCLYIVMSEQRDPFFQLDKNVQIKLRRIRRESAERWLVSTEPQSENVLLQTHLALLKSQINLAPLTKAEIQFAFRGQEEITDSPEVIQILLAALIYRRFDQLSHLVSEIPHWLLKCGTEILLQCPKYFRDVGEIDTYCYYLQNITHSLYEQLSSERNNPELNQDLHKIATLFIRYANFIPLRLTESPYKDLLARRTEILKFLLYQNQCRLEKNFIKRSPSRKIRVGIITESFASTPETYVSLPLYEHLDRERFEIILYALKRSGQLLEHYCQSLSSSFKILSSNLKSNVDCIRADNLDTLFICADPLDINTPVSYLALHQLARFQICYPSLPNMVEDSNVNHLKIPLCISFGSDHLPAKLQVCRKTFGIAEDAIVFVSGTNFSRITPELCHAWAKVCVAIPKSVLFIYPFFGSAASSFLIESFYNQICRIFEIYGIERDRVLLFNTDETIHPEDIIRFLAIADVYLDSYPYSDWVAVVNALQANLPVVARQQNLASTSTLLQELSLIDLIAESEKAYIELAISLGRSQELCEQQRVKIALTMQHCPKFLDSFAQAKHIASFLTHLFK